MQKALAFGFVGAEQMVPLRNILVARAAQARTARRQTIKHYMGLM